MPVGNERRAAAVDVGDGGGSPADRVAGRESFLGVSAPDIREPEIAAVVECIRSGWVTSGPRVARFEQALAEYVDAPHVRCTNSCTAALYLALRVHGIGPGSEVILPSMTFAACGNVIEFIGATPVFVDSDPATGLIDLDAADAAVTPRTAAMMIVHLGGHPVDMDAVAAIRDRHGIVVVEDAAHAIGAEWRGRRIGSWGNPTAFSFHATKNVTTFDGGALALVDEELAAGAARLATQGLTRPAWARHGDDAPAHYDVVEAGFKLAMHDVAASVGVHQLARLDARIAHQERLTRLYLELLENLPLDVPEPPPPHARHARHLMRVILRDGVVTGDLMKALRERGVGTSVHFQGLHLMSHYRSRYGLRPEDFPVATDLSRRSISLPLHTRMGDDDVARVVAALRDALA